MTTPNTTKITHSIIGRAKGIPPNIIAMQQKSGLPFTKQPVNNTSALLKGLVLPGSKRSKKLQPTLKPAVRNNSNDGGLVGKAPGSKKPAPSLIADNLFAEDNNFVEVPQNPEIEKDANHITGHSMNSGVGLDKNWTVIFAHDVVIPVGNPMAPVLALSANPDTSTPLSRQPSAETGPAGRLMTNIYEEPGAEGYISIQELVKRKAAELIDQLGTKNKGMADLFMDRI
jgi:hypothetical protein